MKIPETFNTIKIFRITGFLDFGNCQYSRNWKATTFQKLDLFPFSGEGGRHLLSWAP
jgi:hypothetical protein